MTNLQKTIYSLPSMLIIWFVWIPLSMAQSGIDAPPIDSLINLTRVNNKVIMVGLGADAVTAIATEKGIVVIDAGISGTLTAHYRKIIEKECKRNDFAFVINSHGHHDHTYGNIAFTEANIIAHENSIKEIADRWSDTAKALAKLKSTVKQYDESLKSMTKGSPDWRETIGQRTRFNAAYEDAMNNVAVRYPNILFKDTLHKSMGDVSLDMIYFGKAHTDSDILIHIPEWKLFFVGDLFFKYGRSSFEALDKQDLNYYLKAIEWMETRRTEKDIIINGHGQIMNKEDLESFISIVKKKIKELD
jgi:cyclase